MKIFDAIHNPLKNQQFRITSNPQDLATDCKHQNHVQKTAICGIQRSRTSNCKSHISSQFVEMRHLTKATCALVLTGVRKGRQLGIVPWVSFGILLLGLALCGVGFTGTESALLLGFAHTCCLVEAVASKALYYLCLCAVSLSWLGSALPNDFACIQTHMSHRLVEKLHDHSKANCHCHLSAFTQRILPFLPIVHNPLHSSCIPGVQKDVPARRNPRRLDPFSVAIAKSVVDGSNYFGRVCSRTSRMALFASVTMNSEGLLCALIRSLISELLTWMRISLAASNSSRKGFVVRSLRPVDLDLPSPWFEPMKIFHHCTAVVAVPWLLFCRLSSTCQLVNWKHLLLVLCFKIRLDLFDNWPDVICRVPLRRASVVVYNWVQERVGCNCWYWLYIPGPRLSVAILFEKLWFLQDEIL